MSGAPGLLLRDLNDCGCCEGISVQTPTEVINRPGLAAIAYRVGRHAQFKQSMLARLSGSAFPALANLKTRDDDDFSISLLDGWATVADVLTFYQERLANEFYIRTAAERASILQLARLIGYELRPGVAASTYLAFTMEETPGAPELAIKKTTVDVGTKVQSIPGPDEKPQMFETVEKIEARLEWNAVKPQLSLPQNLNAGTQRLFLKGVNTQLQAGDAIVLIDKERETNANSTRWAFRLLQSVNVTDEKGLTEVTWKDGLQAGLPSGQPAKEYVRVFALRQRAALFGHNAPEWLIMPLNIQNAYLGVSIPPITLASLEMQKTQLTSADSLDSATESDQATMTEWPGLETQVQVNFDLDAVYPRIVTGGWVVLTKPGAQLCKVTAVDTLSLAKFGLSARVTRIHPDVSPGSLTPRKVAVFAQSEELELADEPLAEPLFGADVALNALAPDFKSGKVLAVSGKRTRVKITASAQGLQLTSEDDMKSVPLQPGDLLQVKAAPVLVLANDAESALTPEQLIAELKSPGQQLIKWSLIDRDGFAGFAAIPTNRIKLQPAKPQDAIVSEVVFINHISGAVVTLEEAIQNCYDRDTVTINANVALATHGETVQEVLGSGDASQQYQRFTLRQPPLTHTSAPTPSGAESTLEVRINDILWRQVPTLYGKGPFDRVYVQRLTSEGSTTIQGGDGLTGARLPTGRENVRAKYRKGIGVEGSVKAKQLSLLMTRPLGVKEVINPVEATGADDPESEADSRRSAPLTVLTLDRTVSLRDYEDFVRAYAGIAKALATWTWEGDGPGIFITVAAPNGDPVLPNSTLCKNLLGALEKAGDPFVRFRVKTYRKASFKLAGKVIVHPDYMAEKVLKTVEVSLRGQFSFEARDFGQPVVLSEVISAIHDVAGVVAVDIDTLYRAEKAPAWNERLVAEMPESETGGDISAAELLVLDPAPLDQLGVMQ